MTDATQTKEQNTGHGHVRRRPDGIKARCGGPGLCAECSRELAAMERQQRAEQPTSKMQLTLPYDTPVCKHGRPASVCETCEIERLTRERNQAVKTSQEIREDFLDLMRVIQRYQPPGSPPPGGGVAVAKWALETLSTRPAVEIERLTAESEARHQSCLVLMKSVTDHRAEIERLSALVKKAGDLLTYGGPDMELQSDDGSDWLDQCDKWFKAANYGQPKPMPAVETKTGMTEREYLGLDETIVPYCKGCGITLPLTQGTNHFSGCPDWVDRSAVKTTGDT